MKMIPTITSTPFPSFENSSNVSVWFARLRRWHRDHRTRLQLADLPSHMLRDIGLTEPERNDETRKWFWQQ